MKVVYYEQALKEELKASFCRGDFKYYDVMVADSVVVVAPVTYRNVRLFNIVCDIDDTGAEGTFHNYYDVLCVVTFFSSFHKIPYLVSYFDNPTMLDAYPRRSVDVRKKINKIFADELPF